MALVQATWVCSVAKRFLRSPGKHCSSRVALPPNCACTCLSNRSGLSVEESRRLARENAKVGGAAAQLRHPTRGGLAALHADLSLPFSARYHSSRLGCGSAYHTQAAYNFDTSSHRRTSLRAGLTCGAPSSSPTLSTWAAPSTATSRASSGALLTCVSPACVSPHFGAACRSFGALCCVARPECAWQHNADCGWTRWSAGSPWHVHC